MLLFWGHLGMFGGVGGDWRRFLAALARLRRLQRRVRGGSVGGSSCARTRPRDAATLCHPDDVSWFVPLGWVGVGGPRPVPATGHLSTAARPALPAPRSSAAPLVRTCLLSCRWWCLCFRLLAVRLPRARCARGAASLCHHLFCFRPPAILIFTAIHSLYLHRHQHGAPDAPELA